MSKVCQIDSVFFFFDKLMEVFVLAHESDVLQIDLELDWIRTFMRICDLRKVSSYCTPIDVMMSGLDGHYQIQALCFAKMRCSCPFWGKRWLIMCMVYHKPTEYDL